MANSRKTNSSRNHGPSLLQLVERLQQHGPEHSEVDGDVLLHDGLGERLPPLLVERHGVAEHHVLPRVLVLEARLLRPDVVLQVAEPQPRRRPRVEVGGHPVHLAPRHDLHHHGLRRQEHLVRQPGAVHAHQHVGRVHLRRERRHVRAGLRRRHVEPQLVRRRRHLVQVQQPPGAGARDDQHPGPRPGLLPEGRGPVARQRQRAAQEPREVHHRQVARVPGRVRRQDQVPVAVQPQERARGEAVHGVVLVRGVEAHHVVPGQLPQHRRVLLHPPRLVVGHQQLHVAVQVRRRQEQRDQRVRHVVEEVVRVPGHGEHHRRRGVLPRALGRHRGRRHRLHRHLRHAGEKKVVLAGVRPDPLLAALVEPAAARRVHQVHRPLLRAHADVAGQLAHGRPGVREPLVHAVLVANHLAYSLPATTAIALAILSCSS
uniref:Uncharacterized protein n=1 Tax=Zea mays TaxID=4577 RepID=A0A804P5I8_MAIZE